jgi:hypothetical protein
MNFFSVVFHFTFQGNSAGPMDEKNASWWEKNNLETD